MSADNQRSPGFAALLNFYVPGLGLAYAFDHLVPMLLNLAATLVIVQHYDYRAASILAVVVGNAALAFLSLAGVRLLRGEPALPVAPAEETVPDEVKEARWVGGAFLVNLFFPGYGTAYALAPYAWSGLPWWSGV